MAPHLPTATTGSPEKVRDIPELERRLCFSSRRVGPIMLSDRPQGAGIDRCGPTVTGRNVDLPLLVETSVTTLRYSNWIFCDVEPGTFWI